MSIFLYHPKIKGESSDPAHKDWIDITSWKWGVERAITSSTSTRGDRESSNATITNLIVTKYMDSATPQAFIESCCGTGQDVTLHLTKTGTGSGSDVFMEFNLKHALISKLDLGGTDDSGTRPLEAMSISFVEAEVKYTAYDEDGIAVAPIAVGFDTATNTKS